MKVLLISSDNLFIVPYLSFYLNLIERNGIEYKVIYWDKVGNETMHGSNFIRFCCATNGKIGRMLGYVKFRSIILSTLKNENFDLIIPLHAQVNVLIADKLLGTFKKRFIFDVRDYSYERFKVFRYIQSLLVKNSMINIISSAGYKSFLPKGHYWVCHNIPPVLDATYKQYKNCSARPIEISYIGSIRFMEQNKKIILFFKNDSRFHINFIGVNAFKLKKFCNENGIKNVTLVDEFSPNDTLKFFGRADMIMNLYGNHNPLLDYALSNKLYYSVYLYKPILVCRYTYMETIAKKYHLGFSLELKDLKEKDNLYRYIRFLNRNQYIRNCDYFWKKVLADNIRLNKKLDECLKNLKG
jgi:hypothetical protein